MVDIPKDITAAVTEFEPQTKKEHTRALPEAGEEELRAVAEMINQSERPAIYFGGGVAAADAGAALLALMNKASIPATRTLMASGVLSYDEPKNLGLLGMHGSRTANLAVDEADLVLALGTRFSDRVALNTDAFARNAKIVQIDIDQSEINKNVEVSLGVVGDIGHALERLLPMVEEKHHPQWWRIIADSQAADYTPEDDDTVLKPHQVIGKICELAGEDSIIATDVGQHQMWAAQYCKRVKTRSFLTSGGLGTMGYGYGAALGAQVAFPDRPVIHIYRGRQLSHEHERMLHGGELQSAGDHGDYEQHGAGHGAPMAGSVLRAAVLFHQPGEKDKLSKGGRGLWRKGLSGAEFAGI